VPVANATEMVSRTGISGFTQVLVAVFPSTWKACRDWNSKGGQGVVIELDSKLVLGPDDASSRGLQVDFVASGQSGCGVFYMPGCFFLLKNLKGLGYVVQSGRCEDKSEK
jgi:hypothetical protein